MHLYRRVIHGRAGRLDRPSPASVFVFFLQPFDLQVKTGLNMGGKGFKRFGRVTRSNGVDQHQMVSEGL